MSFLSKYFIEYCYFRENSFFWSKKKSKNFDEKKNFLFEKKILAEKIEFFSRKFEIQG